MARLRNTTMAVGRVPSARWSAGRRQLQRAVWPAVVVVSCELAEDAPQVPLIHDDDVVEAFTAQGPHQPLGDPFACGVAIGVSTVSMPMRRARATKSPPYNRSRSRIRKRGPSPMASLRSAGATPIPLSGGR